MNSTLKTILLTVLTLSFFAIALVELSGVSSHALFNKYNIGQEAGNHLSAEDQAKKDAEVKKMPKTMIEVTENKFDFGKINDGDVVKHTYMVKNIGENPLVISNVQVSCGCTAPSYPKEPIQPGKIGELTLEFNSAGKAGIVNKNALIIANADNAPYSIGFSAEVLKK